MRAGLPHVSESRATARFRVARRKRRWYNGWQPRRPDHASRQARNHGRGAPRSRSTRILRVTFRIGANKQMNKAEFIEAVADDAELTKADAGRAVDAMIAAITKALKKGDTVTLVGFGTFYGPQARRPHRPQPAHRRDHQDQGLEEPGVQGRQGAEGRGQLIVSLRGTSKSPAASRAFSWPAPAAKVPLRGAGCDNRRPGCLAQR